MVATGLGSGYWNGREASNGQLVRSRYIYTPHRFGLMSTGHVNDMNNCAAGGICWSFEVGKALGGAVGWQQRKNTTGDEEFL